MARLKPVTRLEGHLGFWLRLVSNQVSRSFEESLAAKGVAVAEWVLLRALYGAAPEAPSRLAQMMGMTKGGVTKLADKLIAKGLLVRRPDPADARAQTLALTPAGERIVPELAALADANDAAFFKALSVGERKALQAALRKISAGFRAAPVPID